MAIKAAATSTTAARGRRRGMAVGPLRGQAPRHRPVPAGACAAGCPRRRTAIAWRACVRRAQPALSSGLILSEHHRYEFAVASVRRNAARYGEVNASGQFASETR
jgi:hypothetical protein